MFFNRLLIDTETRYWPTELKIANMVWVVKKIRYMIEASIHKTIIYTDYFATVSIVRQTSLNIISVEKLKYRLMKTLEYFQRFRFDVCYKLDKINIIPDIFFRFATKKYRPSAFDMQLLNALLMQCYYVNVLKSFRNSNVDWNKNTKNQNINELLKWSKTMTN